MNQRKMPLYEYLEGDLGFYYCSEVYFRVLAMREKGGKFDPKVQVTLLSLCSTLSHSTASHLVIVFLVFLMDPHVHL